MTRQDPHLRYPGSGIYQHYKGPLYLVLGIAHDANDEGREVVVYVPLELNQAHRGPRMAVRTVADFIDFIDDGKQIIPRFSYVGQTYEGGPQ